MKKEKNKSVSPGDLHDKIGNIPVPEPSGLMDAKFRLLIKEEKKRLMKPELISELKTTHPAGYYVLRIAAGVALFLSGWFTSTVIGTNNRQQLTSLGNEVNMLRETLVLAMVQQNSSVERIKAVQMSSQLGGDEKIIESLLDLLTSDENDNVRLMALEELIKYADQTEVREGLVNCIAKQTSPLVQIRLAEIMMNIHETRSVPEFQKILQNINLNYTVKNKIDETLHSLTENV
ncbi:MAG TPA: HEAT repeat domain-containing protein [Bacteroidales bacterium]|nr:HEAT repeat domain-containing protein [Bacteroidales bacterium]